MACAYPLVITSAAAINTDMRISLHIPIYNGFILKISSYKQRVSDVLSPPPSFLFLLCFHGYVFVGRLLLLWSQCLS